MSHILYFPINSVTKKHVALKLYFFNIGNAL